MRIESIDITKINPAEYNPRKDLQPSDTEYQKLKKSIDKFDLVEPLIWNEKSGNLVGGHQRLKILHDRGDTKVEVSVVNLEDAEEKALNLALNKISGEWDDGKLSELLNELSELPDFDIELTGFDADEVAALNSSEVIEDDFDTDAALDAIDEPVTKLGDIILLGRHRLMCGDSTDEKCVAKLMDGHKADMVFTDPPYGVNYVGKTKEALKIKNDAMSDHDFLEWLSSFFSICKIYTKSGGAVYICHADSKGRIFREAFEVIGEVRQCIIWEKQHFVMGRQDYQWIHEPILYGWSDGGAHKFYGGRSQTTIWKVDRPMASKDHPTMKPVGLVTIAIQNSSKSEDIISDYFAGSGSTLIAAEQTNRICYGMELDPKYCDVIIKRWDEFTGLEAVRL